MYVLIPLSGLETIRCWGSWVGWRASARSDCVGGASDTPSAFGWPAVRGRIT